MDALTLKKHCILRIQQLIVIAGVSFGTAIRWRLSFCCVV